MEISVNTLAGEAASKVELSDLCFDYPYKEGLIHQVVTQYSNAARAGTKAGKNRSAVSGGGIKPWRQKGTGRARAGTSRSPLWRAGGVTFAASPRSYKAKTNKKMYKKAMASILSELLRTDRLIVVDSLEVKTPKTKDLLASLATTKLNGSKLLVVSEVNANLILASRNIKDVDVYEAANIDPLSLIAFDYVIVSADALKKIEERLA